EGIVALDIGDELVLGAGAQRADRVHIIIDLPVLREEMLRSEGVGVAAVPEGANARTKKRRGFDQQNLPPAHQHELVGGGTTGDTAADDKGFLHDGCLTPTVWA